MPTDTEIRKMDESGFRGRGRAGHAQPSSRARGVFVASTCTLLGDESESDEDEIIEQELIDLTIDESEDIHHSVISSREQAINRLDLPGGSIKAGDLVQVADTTFGSFKVQFILVKVVLINHDRQTVVRGIPIARTRCMLGKLPRKLNEVCMICHFNQPPDILQQTPALIDIAPSNIGGTRSFIMTNALYPTHNPKETTFADLADQAARLLAIEEQGTLVCRWKLEVYKLTPNPKSKHCEEVIRRISLEEVEDERYKVNESRLRTTWRGETTKGGSWSPANQLSGSRSKSHGTRAKSQRYTLFDSFSGAGGVSRGAQMAGFHVQYGVDKCPGVWDTYRANFPQASLHMGSVDSWIQKAAGRQTKADILHLSPPCQPFSPAHTHEAAHDDENRFALMGCCTLISTVRPRIATLEQTFGITHDRHGEYMRILINDFTSQGFSLRWKVVCLATWGSAQDRKRLILIAAAPGERLPNFPAPSHSEDGTDGLKPFNTISRVLDQVCVGDDLHDLEGVRYHDPPRAPIPGDRLAGTITTSPGGFYYPDGSRDLTLREYASLQGFPRHHIFLGTRKAILRQIGNAFPPNTVRHLYKHIEKWLLEQDGMSEYQPLTSEVIVLDAGHTPRTPLGRHRRLAAAQDGTQTHDLTVMKIVDMRERENQPFIDLT
ncbi:c-5 cytosine-specific DNA methylase domain-containing protein [Sarocladium implicatum]|nr:c-5 cytosine-specific DNA methylase domain-containing protein [Sarocladium implicatum]